MRLRTLTTLAASMTCVATTQAQVYISNVPDWCQPIRTGAPGGSSGDWRAWCVPTSAANIFGFHRDAGHAAGFADPGVFPSSSLWGAPDFQDECADPGGTMDLGWYLDTNGLGVIGAANHSGTRLARLADGLREYFAAHGFGATFVRNFGASDTARMPSSLFCEFDTTSRPQDEHDDAAGWREITREIDAGRPMLVHFTHGNLVGVFEFQDFDDDFPDAEHWSAGEWDPEGNTGGDEDMGEVWDEDAGLGHTMTVVGYWPAPSPIGGDAIIVFDNRDVPFIPDPNFTERLPLVVPWNGAPWAGLTSVAPTQLLHVDAGGPAGSGASWADPISDLRQALVGAASAPIPTEVWVKQGTYTPAVANGPRNSTFQLSSAVGIYGGFNGTETARDQRDPRAYVTTLSGDLNGDDGSVGAGENVFHVVTGNGVDATAVLDGFTITAGNANVSGGETQRGAGMLVSGAEDGPTVLTCTFLGNFASEMGGGMYVRDADPTLIDCAFIGNYGGLVGGGGLYNWRAKTYLLNCLFSGNSQSGGNGGGGMAEKELPGSRIVNCTFCNNTSTGHITGGGGGLLVFASGDPQIVNSIFWNNSDDTGSGEGAQIHLHAPGFDMMAIDHSTVQGWSGTLGGAGNLSSNPLFIDADGADDIAGTVDDDLRLGAGSPCIDAGDSAAVGCMSTDIGGNDRDGDPDMGSYEHDASVYEPTYVQGFENGDLNGWSFEDSTNGAQAGGLCPGDWSTDLTAIPIDGLVSARLFAEADMSCAPWQLNATMKRNVGDAVRIRATLRFDSIEGNQGVGHAFLDVTAINASDPAKSYTYRFSSTPGFGNDSAITVNAGDTYELDADIAADYASKYDEPLTGGVILKLRASADYAEGGDGLRTADIAVDLIEIVGTPNPCPHDVTGDGVVDVSDLLGLLGAWGSGDPLFDFSGDGIVDVADMLAMLGAWGPCAVGG